MGLVPVFEPQREYLDEFSAFGEEAYAEWLRRALNAWRFGSRSVKPNSREAFFPVETYMGLTAEPADDLADIVAVLDDEDRVAFGRAVARAFNGLDLTDHRHATIAEDLIRLAANVGAHGVLLELARLPPRRREEAGGKRLFALTLRLFDDLATPARPEVAAALRLVLHNQLPIPPEWAPVALRALARSAPDDLVADLALLAAPLADLLDVVDDQAEDAERAAYRSALLRAVAARVPNDAVLQKAISADRRQPGEEWKPLTDDWMRAALYAFEDRTLQDIRRRVLPDFPSIIRRPFVVDQPQEGTTRAKPNPNSATAQKGSLMEQFGRVCESYWRLGPSSWAEAPG